MSELQMKKKTVLYVDYSDLDTFICAEYGVTQYEFVADHEAGNMSSYEFDISGKTFRDKAESSEAHPESEWDANAWKKWRASDGASGLMTRNILQDLCARGRIPAGEDTIHVFW